MIATDGPARNKDGFPTVGVTDSLVNNLIASLKGWGIPINPTLFGPLRSCLYPRIFRSNNVINATFSSTGTIIKSSLIMFKIALARKEFLYN